MVDCCTCRKCKEMVDEEEMAAAAAASAAGEEYMNKGEPEVNHLIFVRNEREDYWLLLCKLCCP